MTVPLVTVLMATRNGARYLGEQLDSLERQVHGNWRLMVSDDGSDDGTWALLEAFQARIGAGRVTLGRGPQAGATANFMALIARTGPQDGNIALCDQDDVWLPEKLARAAAALAGAEGPALYACRSLIVDAAGARARESLLPRRDLGLWHALAENTLPGNTMVLNPPGAAAVRAGVAALGRAGGQAAGFHDWFCYQLIAAAGGRVIYDPEPGIRYRQHPGNLVGSGQGRVWSRLGRLFGGRYARSLRLQAEALVLCGALGPEDRARVASLLALRAQPFWRRPAEVARIGIYRQRWLEDLALKALMLAGRV